MIAKRTTEANPPISATVTRSRGRTNPASCSETRPIKFPGFAVPSLSMPPDRSAPFEKRRSAAAWRPFVAIIPPLRLPPLAGSDRGRLLLGFLELAITDELLQTCFQQLVDRLVLHLAPRILQRLAHVLQHRVVIAVRSARRLVDD